MGTGMKWINVYFTLSFIFQRQDLNGKGLGNGSFLFGVTESSRARGREPYRTHPPAGGERKNCSKRRFAKTS